MKWYPFPHFEPPTETALYVRNWPFPGGAVLCSYRAVPQHDFVCADTGYAFPGMLAYKFAIAPDPLPTPPVKKTLAKSKYRDFIDYQPEEGQTCWVRAASDMAAPFKATYTTQTGSGVFLPTELPTLLFPWYAISEWRPAS
jgi:hypothetical protein